jgi:hypothetical protein
MNEIQVRDLLFEMLPPEADSDWGDVLDRVGRRSSSFRRLTLLVAVALFAVLAVGSALALSGRLSGLLHGTPVKDLTPRERFLMSEFDMKGKAELIAERGSTAFYVIRRPGGRLCYSVGENRKNLTPAQREGRFRFGGADCIDSRIFPSRPMPVLSHPFFSYRSGDSEARMGGLNGFAADPVAGVGVIGPDNGIAFTIPVQENVFSAGKRTIAGGRGIIALGKGGDVLWVQCFAMARPSVGPQFPSGGCGKYKNSPSPNLPPAKPSPTATPTRPSGPLVVQRGSSDGVNVLIRGSKIEANFEHVSAQTRRLLVNKDGGVVLGCFGLVKVGGTLNSSGTYYTEPFATVIRIGGQVPLGSGAVAPTAPFDGCTTMGTYGHTWNDAHGTHDTIEIPLTPRARRFFADRATARDIAWLARARVFHNIRYARQPLTSDEVARRLGTHLVSLRSPKATPPIGKLGIWVGEPGHIVLVERATTGRRLYLELRRGVQYRTNLLGLA